MAYERVRDDDTMLDMGALLRAFLRKLPRIALVTLLLLAATYALLLFVPRLYESTAAILVEPRANAYSQPASQQLAPTAAPISDAGVVSSQIELIKSRDTLLKVVDAENLRSVPEFNGTGGSSPLDAIFSMIGRSSQPRNVDNVVLGNLLERMSVIQERDSRIISIIVRSTDPDLAARLANAVANAHVARRAELSLSDTAGSSVWLEEQIEKLRLRVQEAEARVANFRVDNDLFQGANNTSLIDQQLSSITGQISAAQERGSSAETRAALIRGLIERGQPIEGVPDVRESVVVQQLSQAKANLQGELAQRSATLLPNHPTIQALRAQIAELDRQISNEGRSVAAALDAQAEIEVASLGKLQDQLTASKGSAGTATRDTVQLDDLQREAKAQRDLLESYLLRYRDAVSRSESSSALPDVRVVTLAAASVAPASPKSSLILFAVGLVSLVVQIGAVFTGELLSGRAVVQRTRNWGQIRNNNDAMPQPAFVEEPADGSTIEGQASPVNAAPQGSSVNPVPASYAVTAGAMAGSAPPSLPAAEMLPPPIPEAGTADRDVSDYIKSLASEDGAPVAVESTEQVIAPTGEVTSIVAAAPRIADVPLAAVVPATVEGVELSSLSADVLDGRVKVLMLAALGSGKDTSLVVSQLVSDALRRGLSVVKVDAGSWRPSTELGLTDLSAESASFGDVVHRGPSEGVAEVPWGHLPVLDRRSSKPLTLVEALSDIYEVVLVQTGRIGMTSSLPMFAGLDCRVVLVNGARVDPALLEAATVDARSLGYPVVQVVAPPQRQSEVA